MGLSTKNRPVFKTAVPFTETRWPELTSVDRDNILDLLCSLLQPLGDHRRTHINPSRGKKRKRKSNQPPTPDPQSNDSSKDAEIQNLPPPPPEIGSHILIGLNSVTRHLEALAAQNAPATLAKSSSDGPKRAERDADNAEEGSSERKEKDTQNVDTLSPLQPLSLVVITHNHPPASLPYAHIPTLIHCSTTSPNSPTSNLTNTTTRLITLTPASEARLASALHIPHVGALAIKESAPGASTLVEYAREHVGITECAWIDEAMRGEWKATKIEISK